MPDKRLQDMTLEELWELFPVVLTPHNPQSTIWTKVENPDSDAPEAKVDLPPPENILFLTPEEFGRRGQFYFGLSVFEGFELADAFTGKSDAVSGVDLQTLSLILHLLVEGRARFCC